MVGRLSLGVLNGVYPGIITENLLILTETFIIFCDEVSLTI